MDLRTTQALRQVILKIKKYSYMYNLTKRIRGTAGVFRQILLMGKWGKWKRYTCWVSAFNSFHSDSNTIPKAKPKLTISKLLLW